MGLLSERSANDQEEITCCLRQLARAQAAVGGWAERL